MTQWTSLTLPVSHHHLPRGYWIWTFQRRDYNIKWGRWGRLNYSTSYGEATVSEFTRSLSLYASITKWRAFQLKNKCFPAFTISSPAGFVCCPRKGPTRVGSRGGWRRKWGYLKEHGELVSAPGKSSTRALNRMLFYGIIKWIHFSWPTC
jgi:hypothetical protein